jgi:hypothetical protein
MTFFSTGTPTYEGTAQPKANCSTGFLGWINELLGFPCTPEYETGPVYGPPQGEPSTCGAPLVESYPGESVYVVTPQ